MKVRISTVIPFIFMLSLYMASISAFFKAEEIRQAEFEGYFECLHGDEWNNWHYAGSLLLLFAIGSTVGAIKWSIKAGRDESQQDKPKNLFNN